MRNAVLGILALVITLAGLGFFYIHRPTEVIAPSPSPNPSSSTAPNSQISFPAGGESLVKGQTYTLKWLGGGENTVQIFLVNTDLQSQGESVSIVDRKYNVPNSGSYSYTVPQNISEGNYKFEIGYLSSNPFEITSSAASTSFCSPKDLQASLSLSPGAGNVYGTFTLKNVSGKSCQVEGGEFIDVSYSSSVKNIKVTHQGQTQPQPFDLSPNQTLYSQVHYPNGPQCQGPTQPTSVTFTYKISPTDTVTFKSQANNIPQVVQACQSPTDITEVQIWQMSDQPITPQ